MRHLYCPFRVVRVRRVSYVFRLCCSDASCRLSLTIQGSFYGLTPARPDTDLVRLVVEDPRLNLQHRNEENRPPPLPRARGYPIVEFSLPNGGKRTLLTTPDTCKVELPTGEAQASGTSIDSGMGNEHPQVAGERLEHVKVDLGKVFEQAYVALSRATSLEGLQVLNFNKDEVMAHPKVAVWSRTLETV
ncbi:hypothetical protein B0H14DRAFT_3485232 [Mycena olivaceomarginata]|nr:hypothetical protein B0H14DRAFT_3485232 [Mycena olivaceomarginata]